jgi:hypothetical protein
MILSIKILWVLSLISKIGKKIFFQGTDAKIVKILGFAALIVW